jgi:nitroimidazol reductase NimA-like FMN-containing flavoprotein (pyridoxamine 5'-phosphate oxidase superfamily)
MPFAIFDRSTGRYREWVRGELPLDFDAERHAAVPAAQAPNRSTRWTSGTSTRPGTAQEIAADQQRLALDRAKGILPRERMLVEDQAAAIAAHVPGVDATALAESLIVVRATAMRRPEEESG